jgi:hypothetical protein
MPTTDYHDEELPDPGGDRDQWGDILNDLLQHYDGQIGRRGAKSERPSAADVPAGAKYVVGEGADEGAVYIEDGGSWVKLPVNVAVYSDDSNAPAKTVYFDSADGQLEYKDAGGTIHSGSFSGNPSDLNQEGAADGEVLTWDDSNSQYEPQAGGGGSGTVDATRVYASSAQTISTGTVTQFEIDSTNYDYGGLADTANNQVTIQSDGIYAVLGSIEFQENSGNWSDGDEILTRVHVNGTNEAKLTYRKIGDQFQGIPPAPTTFDLNAGDTISLHIYHNSGVDQQTYQNSNRAFFSVTQIAVGGGQDWQTVGPKTANYGAGTYEHVLVDASGGDVSVTAPAPADDVVFAVKRADSSGSAVTVETPNSETIDGDSSVTVGGQWDSYVICSDGSDYYIK